MNNWPRHYGKSICSRLILWICLLLFCALASGSAAAKTPLEQEWSRYDGWHVAWLKLQGSPGDVDGDLQGGLALAGKGRLLRGRTMPDFRTTLLQQDMARIRLFLAREGFPAAAVVPLAVPEPGAGRLGVILDIVPGPMVRVEAVEFPGWPSILPLPDSTAGNVFSPGDRFRDIRLEKSRSYLLRYLMDAGYALAAVEISVLPVDSTGVAVEFSVTPGDLQVISEVTVAGCSSDLEPLTRRLIDITPPERYSRTRLEDAVFDLRSTQLYRQVAMEVNPQAPGRLSLSATVENARMRSIESSLGTWSDNPWMVRAGWSHRNLFGGGRGLDVRAAMATHTQSAGGGMTWFGWLSPRARTRAGAEWSREDEEAYLAKEWGLDLTQSIRSGRSDLTNVGISISRISLTSYSTIDQSEFDRDGNMLELWADRKWDWTDDPLYPAAGGFGKLTATWSPASGLSESPYISVQGDFSLYRSLGGGAVLAGRGRAGWAKPLDDAGILIPNRRFYAGGYSTMRGYGRRQLGPRDSEGIPGGGDVVMLAGVEARLPVIWICNLSVFMDAGQVWWKPGDIRLSEMETAVGLSLDVRSPLGPVRFGYAWNLGDVYSGEPQSMAHFGVGYPW